MVILDTVRAVAERERVNRNDRTPDVSGTEQSASSAAGPADQQGDLNAIAATIPGVTPILGAEGDPGRLLRARALGRSEQHDAQRRQPRQLDAAARRAGLDLARHGAVRREPRRLQRRAAQRAQRQRARTSSGATTA